MMKLSHCVFLALLGSVVTADVPTFTWLQEEHSPAGVPLLSINFHDGKPDDVAVLEPFNPVPRQPKELEKNIDKCIFKGQLRDEPDVTVTLTGGCPFDKDFDVMFLSKRLSHFKFQVKGLKAEALPAIFKNSGLVTDEVVKPPASAQKPFKNPEVAPNALDLVVELNFDERFEEKFGEDSWNAVRRVATHATNMYTWSSLNTKLNWQITKVYSVPEYGVIAAGDWLEYISAYNNPDVNSNVYFGYEYDEYGTVGLAYLGTICTSYTQWKTAICEYFKNDLHSAEIAAHEVGHNTGMDHDFDGSAGNPRYDSQGRACTNIGGIMDYTDNPSRWSTCSNEDFSQNDHSCL